MISTFKIGGYGYIHKMLIFLIVVHQDIADNLRD